MKILGLNSIVKVKGATATVTGISSTELTLTGKDYSVHQVPLETINRMIDENDFKAQSV